MQTFESRCGHPGCDRPIITYNGGQTWKHRQTAAVNGETVRVDGATLVKHRAYAHGEMRQL